jgi:hypothetical protein
MRVWKSAFYLKETGYVHCRGVELSAELVAHGRKNLKVKISPGGWLSFLKKRTRCSM